MKKLLLLILFLSPFLTVKAQQVLFSENFEYFQGYQITGWPQQLNGGYPWQTGWWNAIGSYCFTPHNNPTKIAGIVDNYVPNPQTSYLTPCTGTFPDSLVRLNTPRINLANVSHAALKYDSYFIATVQNGKTEAATLEVSTDSGANWSLLQHVIPDPLGFHTWYADLSAYAGDSNVRIGFKYEDKGETMGGWMIDNIEVYVPQAKDIALLSVSPEDPLKQYAVINSSVLHKVIILNNGTDTIHSFTLKYQKGSGIIQTYNVSGVQILPFTTDTITHPIPDTVFTVSNEKVTMWAELAGDNNHQNDTAFTNLNGAAFMPQKTLTIEEGTGTYNIFGPRGWVLMNQASTLDFDINEISIHDTDPMGYQSYHDYIHNLNYYYVPYFLFDRKSNIPPENFMDEVFKRKDDFGFANIDVSANLFGNNLSVNATVHPAVDLQGDFRLCLVITEDSVRGTGSGYAQKNAFSGGPIPMGGFENLPNPVPASQMFYNFVARSITPSPEGVPNMLPANMSYQNSYSYTFNTTLDPSWDKNRLKAMVLLLRVNDTSILNSKKIYSNLYVLDAAPPSLNAGVYPNPTSDNVYLYCYLDAPEKLNWIISDLTGRTVKTGVLQGFNTGRNEINIPVTDLNNGMYLLTLKSKTAKKTMRLDVFH